MVINNGNDGLCAIIKVVHTLDRATIPSRTPIHTSPISIYILGVVEVEIGSILSFRARLPTDITQSINPPINFVRIPLTVCMGSTVDHADNIGDEEYSAEQIPTLPI